MDETFRIIIQYWKDGKPQVENDIYLDTKEIISFELPMKIIVDSVEIGKFEPDRITFQIKEKVVSYVGPSVRQGFPFLSKN